MTPPATPSGPTQGAADPQPTPAHRLHYVARTNRGLIRSTNQDSLFAGDRLLVVADGMGGHAAGDTASRLVVDAFMSLNEEPPGPDLLRLLLEATRAGNASIADMVDTHPDLEGMGTTVTAMLFDGGRAALAHVGDSRAYLYRAGVLHQLTHDDTFVQSLVDDGRITEHQAHEHPQRNLLLRALTGQELDPMLAEREIRIGDRYMLCSDGLSGVVDPESIADALAHPDPEIAADTLIQLALVNGGPDNVTTIVADVLATGGRDDADVAVGGSAFAHHDDPSSTNPIAQLTREMPRVPLPPIPEEPAASAEILDAEDDEDTDDGARGPGVSLGDSDDTATAADDDDEIRAAATGLASRRPSRSPRDAPDGGATRTGVLNRLPRGGRPNEDSRRHWYRRGAVIVAALVLLGAAITGSTLWVRHQYYVSEQGNVVVVFRGVNGSLLGWRFSTFEETSCAGDTDCTPMRVSDLQPGAQNQVRAGIKVGSLSAARTVVQRLSAQLLPPCPPLDSGAGEDGSPATSPPATTAPETSAPIAPTTTSRAPHTATAPAAATVTAPSTPTAPAETTLAALPAAGSAPAAAAERALAAVPAAGAGTAAADPRDTAAADPRGTTDAALSPLGETPAVDATADAVAVAVADHAPTAAAYQPAAPDTGDGDSGVKPESLGAAASSDSVTATPLAPATQTPGVTCRTVQ